MTREVDLPMNGNARDSVRSARIDSSVTAGISGDPRNFGVNEGYCINAAERALKGAGTNVVTGRSTKTKFSGR